MSLKILENEDGKGLETTLHVCSKCKTYLVKVKQESCASGYYLQCPSCDIKYEIGVLALPLNTRLGGHEGLISEVPMNQNSPIQNINPYPEGCIEIKCDEANDKIIEKIKNEIIESLKIPSWIFKNNK